MFSLLHREDVFRLESLGEEDGVGEVRAYFASETV